MSNQETIETYRKSFMNHGEKSQQWFEYMVKIWETNQGIRNISNNNFETFMGGMKDSLARRVA